MQVGIATLGPDDRIVYANPAYPDMLGYSPESMLGLHPLDIVALHHVEFVREQMEARRSGIIAPYQLEGFARGGALVIRSGNAHLHAR